MRAARKSLSKYTTPFLFQTQRSTTEITRLFNLSGALWYLEERLDSMCLGMTPPFSDWFHEFASLNSVSMQAVHYKGQFIKRLLLGKNKAKDKAKFLRSDSHIR